MFIKNHGSAIKRNAKKEQKAVKSMIELGELKYRYVPIVYDALPGTTCWMKLN